MAQAPHRGLWEAGHADDFLWRQLRLLMAEAAQDLQASGQGRHVLSILLALREGLIRKCWTHRVALSKGFRSIVEIHDADATFAWRIISKGLL
ncbi:hypothetical protein D3C78_1575020 [compost metagenome]